MRDRLMQWADTYRFDRIGFVVLCLLLWAILASPFVLLWVLW